MILNKTTPLWMKNLSYFITPRLCVFFLLRMPSIFWPPFWLCEIVQSTLTSYNQYGVGVKGQRGKPELFTNGVLRVSIPSAIASLGFFECLHIYISFLFYIFV